jgi:hypothetical protein
VRSTGTAYIYEDRRLSPENDMNLEELKQYTYDTKAEQVRVQFKKSTKTFFFIVMGIVAAMTAVVYVVFQNSIPTVATAFLGFKVIFDRDLAKLYGVETKSLIGQWRHLYRVYPFILDFVYKWV